MDEFFKAVEGLAARSRASVVGLDGLDEEDARTFQAETVRDEADEALHVHLALKEVTACSNQCGPEPHNRAQVQGCLVAAIIAAGISLVYNDPEHWRETFTEGFERARRGHESAA
ncbi:hypothetical protein [Kitasatospora sp. NPDC059817]|uniref:hypothetical protein n=1 Tax=Kitasatospora sp. NPDC059817 TaxID=3346961 RepID=UPI003663B944